MESIYPHWNDHFVQFGLGAFETMRCIKGEVPLIELHLKRLHLALKAFGNTTFNLESAWEQQLLSIPKTGQFRLKWFLGLDQHQQIREHLYQYPYQSNTKPLKCLALPAPFATKQFYKSSSYDLHWLAHRKATQHQCDDAIYLLPDSQLVECSRAAILLSHSEKGLCADGPNLNSVSTMALQKCAPNFWSQKKIYLNQIANTEQLWGCNALHGLRPIHTIIDLQGRELYHCKDLSSAQEWNERLFQCL
jgi:branched-subunit amino acid aminotransferase/4-amino-4-deoxychorismate lyase